MDYVRPSWAEAKVHQSGEVNWGNSLTNRSPKPDDVLEGV